MNSGAVVAERFDAVADRGRDRGAVRERDVETTYGELATWSRRVTEALLDCGLRPGQRVGLMVPNSSAFAASFFGIARPGGVVAPLNVRYRRQELVYYLSDTEAAALVVMHDAVDEARRALADLETPPALLVVSDGGGCEVLQRGRAVASPAATADSPALLHQYTSGSTGAPKRVVRTHANLLHELECLVETFSVGPDDRFLGVAPFSHVNGLVRTMMTSMFAGATLYPMQEFRRREALETITRECITYFGSVPYMFVILADTPVRGHVDLSSLRTVFSASAPLLPDDNRRFHHKYGVWIRQLYGSTETGTISVNTHAEPERHLGSVGLPLPGVHVEIVDDGREPLPPGHEGEVAIASKSAIRGYLGNPEANATSFRDGTYMSGDLGRKDADGYLTLTGRKKFLINRGGYKVNPLEVEQAIQSLDKVAEVVVCGAPGAHGDEIVRCVIVAREPCSEEEVVRHCQSKIADFKIPSRIEFRDALPKSETGKILRNKL